MKKVIALVLLAVLLSSSVALGHSGRTDSQGCHKDRKTGQRHCH